MEETAGRNQEMKAGETMERRQLRKMHGEEHGGEGKKKRERL